MRCVDEKRDLPILMFQKSRRGSYEKDDKLLHNGFSQRHVFMRIFMRKNNHGFMYITDWLKSKCLKTHVLFLSLERAHVTFKKT